MNINWNVAIAAAAGVALFGVTIWAVRQLPANAITRPIKQAADVVTSG